MKTETTIYAPKVGLGLVRLAGPLAGQYCNFSTGELVKVTTNGNGLATVERATWRNSLTICNVLYGVPSHLVCEITETEPNDKVSNRGSKI